jgi:hypothetical protein
MSIEHANILSADRHEPKGFEAASTDTVYTKGSGWVLAPKGLETASSRQAFIADGVGSGAWQSPMIHASSYNIKTVTPITVTGSDTNWVRFDTLGITDFSATAGTHPEMQSNTDGSLTYIGTLTRHFHIAATLSVGKQTGGSTSHPVACALYHYDASAGTNTIIPHSEIRMSANQTVRASTAIHADIMMDTGDKLVLAVNGSLSTAGLVTLYTYYLFAMGMIGA